ncbi:hypothetical protein PHYSODRAFT_304408 [Phytophthora sojae]|uniref:Retrotransposon gag domain-containing protein n=1 Tax=Phytophthora sojae (strain P6497) TaxID=1094619 RepID=G5A0N5_PHYSP|nr:hypothetical protein PHYSODRAFT_304408 [Phytophthora sojae]EGZ10571.1 hypothetical protein PHYSODRAFT_304408 [Phytophthora sojae]|eukprot:XP_009533316.1 hypothetical protein PHYSODRAFT_304408 [Phytophthora sojae]
MTPPRRSPRIAVLLSPQPPVQQARLVTPASLAATPRRRSLSTRRAPPRSRSRQGASSARSGDTTQTRGSLQDGQDGLRGQTRGSNAGQQEGDSSLRIAGLSVKSRSSLPIPAPAGQREPIGHSAQDHAQAQPTDPSGHLSACQDLSARRSNGPRMQPAARAPVMFGIADHPDSVRETVVPSCADIGDLPVGGKPNRKSITVEAFSGFVPVGAFDSGVRCWWRKFVNQLTDAQILDGHRWADVQGRSIFAASLWGDAADWFSELAGELLVEKNKSKLPEHELLNRLMMEQKARGETYQAYAQRLLNMADSLPSGLSTEANARYAMHTFIKRAYYKYSDE